MKTKTLEARDQYGKLLCSDVAYMPERADIDGLKIGDMAPSAFGGKAMVTRISYRGVSPSGNHYVGYVTQTTGRDTIGNGCGCSNSMVENRLVRSVGIGRHLSSAQSDDLEMEMMGEKQEVVCGSSKNEILDAVEKKALIVNSSKETVSRGERVENGHHG